MGLAFPAHSIYGATTRGCKSKRSYPAMSFALDAHFLSLADRAQSRDNDLVALRRRLPGAGLLHLHDLDELPVAGAELDRRADGLAVDDAPAARLVDLREDRRRRQGPALAQIDREE